MQCLFQFIPKTLNGVEFEALCETFCSTQVFFFCPLKGKHNTTACKDVLDDRVFPTLWQPFGRRSTYGCDVRCPHTVGHIVYVSSAFVFWSRKENADVKQKKETERFCGLSAVWNGRMCLRTYTSTYAYRRL